MGTNPYQHPNVIVWITLNGCVPWMVLYDSLCVTSRYINTLRLGTQCSISTALEVRQGWMARGREAKYSEVQNKHQNYRLLAEHNPPISLVAWCPSPLKLNATVSQPRVAKGKTFSYSLTGEKKLTSESNKGST